MRTSAHFRARSSREPNTEAVAPYTKEAKRTPTQRFNHTFILCAGSQSRRHCPVKAGRRAGAQTGSCPENFLMVNAWEQGVICCSVWMGRKQSGVPGSTWKTTEQSMPILEANCLCLCDYSVWVSHLLGGSNHSTCLQELYEKPMSPWLSHMGGGHGVFTLPWAPALLCMEWLVPWGANLWIRGRDTELEHRSPYPSSYSMGERHWSHAPSLWTPGPPNPLYWES